MSLVEKTTFRAPKRSNYPLSNIVVDDTDFGYVKPVRIVEILGGDYTPVNVGCQLETAATKSPVYGSLRSNIRAFFFPRRLLATVYGGEDIGHLPAIFNPEGATEENAVKYLKFIPYGVDGGEHTQERHPYSLVSPGQNSLLECIGFPFAMDFLDVKDDSGASIFSVTHQVVNHQANASVANAISASPFTGAPIVMYWDIIYNYYSNHHAGFFPVRVVFTPKEGEYGYSYLYIPVSTLSQWLVMVKTGRAAAVTADFTLFDADGCELMRLLPYYYSPPTSPISSFELIWGYVPAKSFLADSVGLSLCTFSPDINTAWISDNEYSTWLSKARIAVKNNEVAYEDIITASSFYREAAKFAFGDGTFEDFYAAVNGVRSRPSATVSQYLGGFSRRVDFQSIRQSAATSEGSLADIGGFAAGAQAGHIVNFYSDEPGYLMICHTLVPDLCYSRGVESYLMRTETDDFYSPNFANIGYQPRRLIEVDAIDPSSTVNIRYSAVGYQPAWTDYTTAVSRSMGSLGYRGSLSGWTFQAPSINNQDTGSRLLSDAARLIYCHPIDFNNIFVVNRPESHNFYMQFGFNIKSRRIIPKRNMPKLML